MGSRLVLALALFFGSAASAQAAPKLFHDSFSSAYRSPFGAVPTVPDAVATFTPATRPCRTSVTLAMGASFVICAASTVATTAPCAARD